MSSLFSHEIAFMFHGLVNRTARVFCHRSHSVGVFVTIIGVVFAGQVFVHHGSHPDVSCLSVGPICAQMLRVDYSLLICGSRACAGFSRRSYLSSTGNLTRRLSSISMEQPGRHVSSRESKVAAPFCRRPFGLLGTLSGMEALPVENLETHF